MDKVIDRIAKSNIFLYAIFISVLNLGIKAFVHLVKFIFQIPDVQFNEELVNEKFEISVNLIIDALVIAPIIETLLFQSLFFFAYKHLKINKWIVIIASSLTFSAIHDYSIFYIIDTALIGFVFIFFYILRYEYNKNGYLSTVVAHFMINFFAIIAIFIKGHFFMS